jgi:multidrug efflux pump subunit AcrB
VKDIYNDIDDYKTNYEVILNHELITRLWLSVKQVAMSVKTMLDWNYVSFSENASSLEPKKIYIKLKKDENLWENLFGSLYFTNSSWKKVPLSEIAQIVKTQKQKSLTNLNWENIITLTGDTTQGNPISSIVAWFDKAIMTPNFLWENYEIEKLNVREYIVKEKWVDYEFRLVLSWEWKTSKDTVWELQSAIWIAFIIIFLIMALKFGSFAIWGIIMMTFLFWFVWILPWYWVMNLLFGTLFTSIWNLWILSLIWIVTWNAIILLEQMLYYKEKEWLSLEESLIKATGDRIGPIIATNATTILWVMTLMGDVVFSGMAFTMAFWLIASVILTLLVFPIFVYNTYLRLEKKKS